MKQLMVIIDGMADLPCDALGGRTPGEAAHTPNLCRLSPLGELLTTPDGMLTDSQTCILSILGVPREQLPHGRAFLEALACGAEVGRNDLLLRLNFVEVRNGRLHRNFLPYTDPLYELPRWELIRVGPSRAILRIPGAVGLADKLETFPPHQHMGAHFEAILPMGCRLADELADASRAMLGRTGGVTFLPWSPSVYPDLPTFEALRGMRGAVVTGTEVVTGIARALSMTCPNIPGATGDTDTDLPAKLAGMWRLLPDHDFTLLHLNGADEAAHRQNPAEKAEFIAAVDRLILGPILDRLDHTTQLVVLSDHATLSGTGAHDAMPVAAWGFVNGALHPDIHRLFPDSVRIYKKG